jgi:hypothetical protein
MEPSNGGSTLLGYEVLMDDGLGGGFRSIIPGLLTVTQATVTSTSNGI